MLKFRPLLVAALLVSALAPVCAAATNDAQLEAAALREAVPDKHGVKSVLVVRGLDKMTGEATTLYVPVGKPVHYATLTIAADFCHATPPLEAPETTAFLQITDTRPGDQPKQVFSGWMFASAPEINAMEHPLYDVWVLGCKTNQPGETGPVASTAPVRAKSPDALANRQTLPELPEGSGQ
ncbi:MAG TPA: DUF2155 domain-containing protein [Rhizomicrobium sp.]|nr:DUF2155 domain-containing protein [Rhizomicrobium sp.]